MNIWDHCRLSARKFGGEASDYFQVHKFLDSSKLFYYHFKHRALLHHTYGVELACTKFKDYLTNSQGKVILVRDIAIAHLKEDHNGQVPTLSDWYSGNEQLKIHEKQLPQIQNEVLRSFVWRPVLFSNMSPPLIITWSDFGIYLCHEVLGIDLAIELQKLIDQQPTIKSYLEAFKITQRWQYTPDKNEIIWLKNQQHNNQIHG